MSHARRTTFALLIFTPKNIQQIPLPLQSNYFAIISENVHSQSNYLQILCILYK